MDYLNRKTFNMIWWISQLFGALCITLVFVWTTKFLGGFGWQNSPLHEFNYHPVFSVLGLVFYGNGILIYRKQYNKEKFMLKFLHTAIFALTFIFMVIALKTVFDSHNYRLPPIANMYSFHSWIGLGTVILFAMQFCIGFLSLLYPGITFIDRRSYLPYHQFFGLVIFGLAIAACHSGIMEKAKASLKKQYLTLPPAAYVANFLGVLLTLFAISVIYLASMPQFKRQTLHEDLSSLELSSTTSRMQQA